MKSTNLTLAKGTRNAEFYTQLAAVKKELDHYRQYFKGKIVYCNCDNPAYSNFWRYFADNVTFKERIEKFRLTKDKTSTAYLKFISEEFEQQQE